MASPRTSDQPPNGISTPPTGSAAARTVSSPPTMHNTPSASQTQTTQAGTQPPGTTGSTSQSQHAGSSQSQNTSSQHAEPPPSRPRTNLSEAAPADSGIAGGARRPRDARLVHMLLAHLGVHAYEERVPLQLLDFAYRYTAGVLADAGSLHAEVGSGGAGGGGGGGGGGKKGAAGQQVDDGISMAALRHAVAARAGTSFNAHLPKEFMLELAQERNRVALPRVEREFGLRLPPEKYCLTGTGWGLREAWESEGEEEGEGVAAGRDGDGDVPMGGEEADDDGTVAGDGSGGGGGVASKTEGDAMEI